MREMDGIMGWLGLRRSARAMAVAELRGFTAAQLADLGIERDQIEAYVDGRLAPRRPRARLRVIEGGMRTA
jgi:uncharacterized protein YjiS (DUF1127 family)